MPAPLKVPTETKSISSWLEKPERKGIGRALTALICVSIFVSACGTLKTREDIRKEDEAGTATPHATPTPRISGEGYPSAPPVPPTPPPAPTPMPAPAPESFLTKEPPKVGVILGPGGMRAFAHVGVLKEMTRARLPIRAVVGLEWGAVIGGLYSMQGQANEAEWKAFKLREDDIPGSGLLNRAIKAEKPSDLGNFLSTVFAGQNIEKTKIDFACPSYNTRTEKFGWWNRGSLKDGVMKCMAFPPFYTSSDGWIATPMAIEEAAGYLRSKGITLVIYVNALGSGEIVNSALVDENYSAYVLWNEVRRQSARKQLPGVNVVINVNTDANGITDFSERRQMMEAGARSSQDIINKLVKQYGF